MKRPLIYLLAGLMVPLIFLGVFALGTSRRDKAPDSISQLVETSPPASQSLISTPHPTPPSANIPFDLRSQSGEEPTPLQLEAPVATAVPGSSKPRCGGPATMNILLIGADNRDNTYLYGLADVVRVLRVDFTAPRISVLALPRDLWVQIPNIDDHYGITHGKLNQAYFYGNPGMGYYDGDGDGPGLLAHTLEQNFGLTTDYFFAVNMETFKELVDVVGGVDIYLPEPVDGRPPDSEGSEEQYFNAGNHHLNGVEALRFARLRENYGDLVRIEHQSIVLTALQERLLRVAVIPDLPEIIGVLKDSVLTDLGPIQLAQLICLFPQIDNEQVQYGSIPTDMLTSTRVYAPQFQKTLAVFLPNQLAIQNWVEIFQRDGLLAPYSPRPVN
jgi:LCP family protein required for cell wall assembly